MNRETLVMMLVMTVLIGLSLSAVFTWQANGFTATFITDWLGRFAGTWPIVVPIVIVAAPIARRITRWLLPAG